MRSWTSSSAWARAVTGAAQTGQLHRSRNLRVTHEPAPHVSRTQILCAEQDDADIYPDHVLPHPARVGVERIRKTSTTVNALAELLPHGAQCGNRDVWRKHQRAASRAWNDCAVNGRITRRPAPRHITFRTVAGRDAPHILGITRELICQADAEFSLSARRHDGVIEIIRIRRPAFAPVAKINPRVRVLMYEERPACDVCVACITDTLAFPRAPRKRATRVDRKSTRL